MTLRRPIRPILESEADRIRKRIDEILKEGRKNRLTDTENKIIEYLDFIGFSAQQIAYVLSIARQSIYDRRNAGKLRISGKKRNEILAEMLLEYLQALDTSPDNPEVVVFKKIVKEYSDRLEEADIREMLWVVKQRAENYRLIRDIKLRAKEALLKVYSEKDVNQLSDSAIYDIIDRALARELDLQAEILNDRNTLIENATKDEENGTTFPVSKFFSREFLDRTKEDIDRRTEEFERDMEEDEAYETDNQPITQSAGI